MRSFAYEISWILLTVRYIALDHLAWNNVICMNPDKPEVYAVPPNGKSRGESFCPRQVVATRTLVIATNSGNQLPRNQINSKLNWPN